MKESKESKEEFIKLLKRESAQKKFVPVKYVNILSQVEVVNLKSKEKKWYGFQKGNSDCALVSINSPVGKALLGKKVGGIVEINVPVGKLNLKIIDIR